MSKKSAIVLKLTLECIVPNFILDIYSVLFKQSFLINFHEIVEDRRTKNYGILESGELEGKVT